MLSFGTELFLAFCTASSRVGLPAGSGPPVRAATSTFLISLANSLPRLASMAAFLCFVVAHLQWPLTVLLRDRGRPHRGHWGLPPPRRPRAARSPRRARGPGCPRSARGGS